MGKKKHQEIKGQYYFGLDGAIREKRPLTSLDQERKYWHRLKEFIDAAASYCRTYSLYCGIKNSPSLDELENRIKAAKNHAERSELKNSLNALEKKYKAMREGHHCMTEEELLCKSEREWEKAKSKLRSFLSTASWLGYGVSTDETPIKGRHPVSLKVIILNFTYIPGLFTKKMSDGFNGCEFRKFVNEKYVKKSLERLRKNEHAEPVSLYELYNNYKYNKS